MTRWRTYISSPKGIRYQLNQNLHRKSPFEYCDPVQGTYNSHAVTEDSNTTSAQANNSTNDSNSTKPSEELTQEKQTEGTDAVTAEEASEPVVVDPLEEALATASQMKEKLMRTAADFDNFRKRSRREVAEAEKKGRDSLLNSLLPIFDNLERATAHATTTDEKENSESTNADMKGLVDGITLVVKQFVDALSRQGIERIESIGQPFDPSVHEAIQHLETNDVPVGCIAAEVQPGYRQGDRLVRPAMVVVAKALSAPAPVANETTSDGAGEGESPEA